MARRREQTRSEPGSSAANPDKEVRARGRAGNGRSLFLWRRTIDISNRARVAAAERFATAECVLNTRSVAYTMIAILDSSLNFPLEMHNEKLAVRCKRLCSDGHVPEG